jgi:hypothetical protein
MIRFLRSQETQWAGDMHAELCGRQSDRVWDGTLSRQEELTLQPHTYNVLLRLCTLVTSSADPDTQYAVSKATANDTAVRVFEHMKSYGVRTPPKPCLGAEVVSGLCVHPTPSVGSGIVPWYHLDGRE